jgi:hypothetical protein
MSLCVVAPRTQADGESSGQRFFASDTAVLQRQLHIQKLARQLMLDMLAQEDPNLVLDEAQPGDPPDVKDFKERRIGDATVMTAADVNVIANLDSVLGDGMG